MEFRKNAGIDKKDFAAIEHLLRKGQKQLEIYESDNVRNIFQ
jgi:succinate dehydrogenase assembly factor 1